MWGLNSKPRDQESNAVWTKPARSPLALVLHQQTLRRADTHVQVSVLAMVGPGQWACWGRLLMQRGKSRT